MVPSFIIFSIFYLFKKNVNDIYEFKIVKYECTLLNLNIEPNKFLLVQCSRIAQNLTKVEINR